MPKVQARELAGFATDTALQNAVKQYKNYCSIRRDLRTANLICSYVINLHESIKNEEIKLEKIADTLFLVRASVMHAIVLYSRWFKSTEGKTILKTQDFFTVNTKEMSVHEKLVEYRDRYIAHNELDLLGADRVLVNTDSSGRFMSSESDWNEQAWLQDNDLNMSKFQGCVHIVHNKIDTEIIPNLQSKLDSQLNTLLGSIC
ncbi:MAG: hypothetical protein ACTFAL_01995 [Candidatus Electronema sp. V4]|uniref:hypothetical protein n=1 Tax=Candidatus Electronema sp. V4 TaxID=3454756 RepID=UPI0040553D9C